MPRLAENAIVDGPAPAPRCKPGIGLAEGCGAIKGLVERAAWLELPVDPAHLVHSPNIVESQPFEENGIVVGQRLDHIEITAQILGELLKCLEQDPRQTEPLPHLSWSQTGIHGPDFLGKVPPHRTEHGPLTLPVPIGAKAFGVGIVDDEQDALDLMERILTDEGFDLVKVNNATQVGLQAAQSIPDVILLDFLMPEVNGFEVCKALKENEQTRHVPIMAVTCLTKEDDTLPERILQGLENGPLEGKGIDKQEFENMKKLYYQMAGWDEDGHPTKAKLAELGLEWCDS